jgi:hypothetical protein
VSLATQKRTVPAVSLHYISIKCIIDNRGKRSWSGAMFEMVLVAEKGDQKKIKNHV